MTPGEHGEAVTSNRDTLAAEARRHHLTGSSMWDCSCSCREWDGNGSHMEHVADALMPTVEAMLAQARAEVVAAVEGGIEALPRLTEGPDRAGTALWPEEARDTYSLAIEEAQAALRAALAAVSGTDHDTTLDTVRAEALREAADVLSSRLDEFPTQGRHTRARWAEQWLRDRADRIAPDDTPSSERGGDGE